MSYDLFKTAKSNLLEQSTFVSVDQQDESQIVVASVSEYYLLVAY